MSKLSSRLSGHRAVILTASLTQLTAVLVGMAIIYSCTRDSPYVANHFWNAIYWGIVGPAGLMLVAANITVLVIGFLCILFFVGARWRKFRLLLLVGVLLWGVWWVFLAYGLCVMSHD